MSPPVEVQYRDLLNPIKDPEKSFAINISDLLQSYITNFIQGNVPPNFNSAALLLQGSSSIYGKKVEYLHNLASSLHDCLLKNKKDEHKKKDPKEKAPKQNKLNDPFFSTEIKPGKNLSCLRRKNAAKTAAASKKAQKKTINKKYSFVPVDLLPLEGEEKGDVFYDTRGEAVGNKADYAINKCRVTTSGWLLLPTVSSDLVSDFSTTSDYSTDMVEDDNHCDSDVDIADTPSDEGYPASSGCPSSPPTAPSSQAPSSQQTDEGLGSLTSTPSEGCSQPEGSSKPDSNLETPMEGVESPIDPEPVGLENIPMVDLPSEDDPSSRPVRRSMRQALRLRQLDQQQEEGQANKYEDPLNLPDKEEVIALKKAIQKKNTCNLPSKLRKVNDENVSLHPASVFCARTFFSLDNKLQKSDLLSLKVTAFANNSKFINQIQKYKDAIKAAKSKRKKSGEVVVEEEDEVEVDEVEGQMEADPEGDAANPSVDDDDFVIDNEPLLTLEGEENPVAYEIPVEDTPVNEKVPAVEEIVEDAPIDIDAEYARAAEEQMALFRDDLMNFAQTSEISEKVREWEQLVKPFLEEIESREGFDINEYGGRLLEAFEDSNRRQTMRFRDFCKGMTKWQIHRYFMALLPLINIGNVSIEHEPRSDGGEDIMITLLSRKMHHLELEDFGHNEGEHT